MFQTKFVHNANVRYNQGFVLFCDFFNLLILTNWQSFPKIIYIQICNRKKKSKNLPNVLLKKKVLSEVPTSVISLFAIIPIWL